MLTNLGFNLFLLLLSDSVFVIGAANIGYLIFNFLNLNAGWIHRLDRPRQERPWRAPTWVLAAGALLSFVNLAFMGFGADVYGAGTLSTGLAFCRAHRAGIHLPPLHSGQGVLPAAKWRRILDTMATASASSSAPASGPMWCWPSGIAVVAVTHRLAVY